MRLTSGCEQADIFAYFGCTDFQTLWEGRVLGSAFGCPLDFHVTSKGIWKLSYFQIPYSFLFPVYMHIPCGLL